MKTTLYLIFVLFLFGQKGFSQKHTNQEISFSTLSLFDIDTPKRNALGLKVDYTYHFLQKRKLSWIIGFYGLYFHDGEDCILFVQSPEYRLPVYRFSTSSELCEYNIELFAIDLGLKIGGVFSFNRTDTRRHELEVNNRTKIKKWQKRVLNSTPFSIVDSDSLGFRNFAVNHLLSPTIAYSYILIYSNKEIGFTAFLGDYYGYSFLVGFESSIRF